MSVRSLKALLGHGFFRPPDSSKVTGVYELVLRQKLYAIGNFHSLLPYRLCALNACKNDHFVSCSVLTFAVVGVKNASCKVNGDCLHQKLLLLSKAHWSYLTRAVLS